MPSMSQEQFDALHTKWDYWFSNLDSRTRANGFEQWKVLQQQAEIVKQAIQEPAFDFSEANRSLNRAEHTLNFARPYQIVVIGESGAGKSSLVNSLLERELMVTGVGGAVTGVATYIYPGDRTSSEEEHVTVVYRSADDFKALTDSIQAQARHTNTTAKVEDTLADIRACGENVRKMNLEGKSVSYHPVRDKAELEELMDEHSARNTAGSAQRVIASIQRIEYHLPQQHTGLTNCILIDTPGLGARTLRHQEILREEIETADVIILIVNAIRPEQQADEVATIMREILFDGYTPGQQSRFAEKIFLVVNKFDVIQSDKDRSRLDISVRAIAEVIAPDYLRLYGKTSTRTQYFEMISTDGERVARLRDQLQNFLSSRRLGLMLGEASTQVRQASDRAREACQEALQGVNFNSSRMSSDTLRMNLTNQVCINRLDRDHKELQDSLDKLFDRLSVHRDSPEHDQNLRRIVLHIRSTLKTHIQQTLPSLLRELSTRSAYARFGKQVVDTAEKTLLIRLENIVSLQIEKEMEEQFAKYYVSVFQEEVQKGRFYDLIDAKSYGQPYVLQEIAPILELEREAQRICNDYVAASRQILVYELIQMPIIESLRRVEGKIWTVVQSDDVFKPMATLPQGGAYAPTTPEAISNQSRGGLRNKAGGWLKKFAGDAFGADQDNTAVTTDLASERQRDKQFLDALRESLATTDPLAKTGQLVEAQFEQRIDNALKKALPFLEDIFFYALDRFQKRYADLIQEIRQAHLLRVNDPQTSIQNILVEQDGPIIARLTQAATLMAQLERVSAAMPT